MANNFLSPYAAAYGGRSPQLSPRGLSPEPGQAYGAWYDPNHGHHFYQHPAAAMDPYMACRSISPNRLSPDPGRMQGMHPQLSPSYQGAHQAQFMPNNMDFYGAFPLNNNYAWNINNNTIVYTDDEEINTNTPGLFYSANALPPPHQVVPPAHDTPRNVASPLPRMPSAQIQQSLLMQQRASSRQAQQQMQHLTLPNQQFKVKQPVEKKTPEQPKQPEKQPETTTKQMTPQTEEVPPVSPSTVSGGSGGSGRSSRLLSISESQSQMSRSQTSSSFRKKSNKKGKLTRYRGNERLPFAAVGMRRAWQMEVTTGAIFLLVGAICVLVDAADDYAIGSMFVGCGLAAFGVVFIITGFVWREQISRKKARKAGYPGATPYSELRNQAVTPTTPSKEFSDGLITP